MDQKKKAAMEELVKPRKRTPNQENIRVGRRVTIKSKNADR